MILTARRTVNEGDARGAISWAPHPLADWILLNDRQQALFFPPEPAV